MTPKLADQAERLRNDFSAKETKIICISGGKGGVGKSLISVNIAVEIAKRGKSVLIFDSDAGFANASILLGKTLKNTLSDYINNNLPLEKCIQKTEYGVNVISTGFDFKDWKIYQSSFSPKMVEDLFLLSKDNDYVIVDIGAGYSETIKPFYLAANDILMVTVPEPTAIVNAYTLIKALSIIGVTADLEIILNMVRDRSEVNSVESVLRKTVKSFLNRDIKEFYTIFYDEQIHESVKRQTPLVYYKENAKFSKSIQSIVEGIDTNLAPKKYGFKERLLSIFVR